MNSSITDILAIAVLIFLFWNNSDIEPDNWDKLNILIDSQYQKEISP
jgi:hypothetical protein